ncbi:MAG: hypothetical protein J6K84_03315 [Oscillospiraceae bacterium]|nr:hypothetical protein [Oscillospiraceae bacterium]
MKRLFAVIALISLLILAGCGAVAEDVPLVPMDPAPVAGDEVSGGEETTPLPVHVHEFSDATCVVPKTCSVCGKTEGAVVSHNYQNGTCSVCGDEQQAPAVEHMVWIPKSGNKYHSSSSCSNMKNPSQVTEEDAIARNYTPCSKCYG